MGGSLKQRWIDPFIMPVIVAGVTVGLIAAMGESLLSIFEPGDTPDRLDRPELWYALALALVIIGAGGFLVTRPKGTTGPLEKEVAIGNRPFFQDPLPPVDVLARTGPLGAIEDIEPGYTLYAQSGELATVEGILPGSDDWGKRFAGFMYARGMRGASDELWIPVEAVMSVYPETKSAFLAIKGDETEVFGWNVPPESVRRGPVRGAHEL
jgi:hypothetical protein